MAGTDAKVGVPGTTDNMEGVAVTTTAGVNLFREGVVVSDPVTADARARVLNTAPGPSDYGQVVRIAGGVAVTGAELAVQDAINSMGYNLQAAAYSQSTAIGSNYLLDRIELKFSTAAPRDILITDSSGAVLRQLTADTSTSLLFDFQDQAFVGGDNVTIAVTQTASPCTLAVQVVILTGSVSLGGNPILDPASYGKIVASNCTSATLLAGQTFTGGTEVDGFADLMISCYSDTSGKFRVYYSLTGGATWLPPITYLIDPGLSEFHVQRKGFRTYRTEFENDSGINQTRFELGVYAGSFGQKVGTMNGTVREDEDCITVRAVDHEELVAEGKFQGRFIINKFGRNPDVRSGSVPEDVWNGGGVYTGFPATGAAETLNITSSDANDTAGGTGARTIMLEGLGDNYQLQTETLAMGGGVPGVNTTLTWRRMHRAVIQTAGSAGTNIGVITIKHTTTAANVFAVLPSGRGRSSIAAYTVPAGYSAYLKRFGSSILGSNTATIEVDIWVREFGKAVTLRNPFTVSNGSDTSRERYGGIKFPEKTDINFRVVTCSSAQATDVTVSYDLLVVENAP